MNAVVGALRATLGINTAQYESGWDRAIAASRRGGKEIERSVKSAEASAAVFLKGAKAAQSMLASIDPLYAAQVRYDKELEKANQLYKQGSLTAGEFAKVQAALKTQLDNQVQSLKRVGGVAGSTRAGMQQLSFQLSDVSQGFALGTKPMTIFAQQSGQIIQSLQLMGGEGNKFLKFLGGPWGLALSAAVSVLGALAANMFKAGEGLDDLLDKKRKDAEQTRRNKEADEAWKTTIEGLTEAIRVRREEQKKSLQTNIQEEETSRKAAQAELSNARALFEATRRDLDAAKARRDELLRPVGAANVGVDPEALAVELDQANKKVAALQKQFNDLANAVTKASQSLRGIDIGIAERKVAEQFDAEAAATSRFTEALGKLRVERQKNIITQAEFNKRLAEETKRLEAAKKAARDAEKEKNKNALDVFKAKVIGAEGTGPNLMGSDASGIGQFRPETWLQQFDKIFPQFNKLSEAAKLALRDNRQVAEAIIDSYARENEKFLKGFGATITAGNLYLAHWFGPGGAKAILQAAPGTPISKLVSPKTVTQNRLEGMTAGQVRDLAAKRIGDSSSDRSAGLLAIDRELETLATRQLKSDNDFAEKKAQLNRQLLDAFSQLADDTWEQAKFAADEIRAEQAKADLQASNDAAEKKMAGLNADVVDAQAAELITINARIADQKIMNIEVRAILDAWRRQEDTLQDEADAAIDRLRFEDEMADTQAERRRIQLEIIDLLYREKLRHLETLKAQAEFAGKMEEAAKIAGDIARLPEQKARDQVRAVQGTRGPLEQFQDTLPTTADKMNEALQSVAVDGLKALEDGILSVIDGTKSLAEAFRDMASQIIAELLRIQIQKAIIGPLSEVLGQALGVGSLFGGGVRSAGLAQGSADLVAAFPDVFATGGYTGNMPARKIAGLVHGQEYVFDAAAVRRIGVGNLDAMRKGLPTPANANYRGGDTFNMPINIPPGMTPKQARETGAQFAVSFQSRVATAKRQGF